MPNSSSSAITSSTVSSESAPRSATNAFSLVTSDSGTPSCSAMIFLTRDAISLMTPPGGVVWETGGDSNGRGDAAEGGGSRSAHQHAAVDVQLGAGDVGRL